MVLVRTYSPALYRATLVLGVALFVGLLAIAWGTDTSEVAIGLKTKVMMTLAAFILGGGLVCVARRYKRAAYIEAIEREAVRRNLMRR